MHALLKAAVFSGAIGSPAYVLASHVCESMQRLGVLELRSSIRDLAGKVVLSRTGELLAGDLRIAFRGLHEEAEVVPMLATALQELHETGLVYSGVDSPSLRRSVDSQESTSYHFTRDPTIRQGRDWGTQTPLYFLVHGWDEDRAKSVLERLKNVV